MAKKEKAAKAGKPAKVKGGKKKGMPLLALIVLGGASLVALPASLVLAAGLIPTFVAAFTDTNPKKNVTVAVGMLNIASALYVVLQLVRRSFTVNYAVQLLSDPFNWMVMWGGAAIGYALMNLIPPIVAQVLASIAEMRILKFRENQQMLKKSWGEKVSEM